MLKLGFAAGVLSVISCIGFTERVGAYPQLIAKGYPRCGTCHIHETGNTLLNPYGRAMAAEFMSTWAREDEASIGEPEYFSLGADYRHLFIDDENVPMLMEFQLALHYSHITTTISSGYFSRTETWENRDSWAKLALPFHTFVRAGYFIPSYGINTSDHSLAIKRLPGLGRGSETHNIELGLSNKIVQIIYTNSSSDFNFRPKGTAYRLGTEGGSVTRRLSIESFLNANVSLGANYHSGFQNIYGLFLRASPLKNMYMLIEADNVRGQDTRAFYARFGYFVYRGIDAYLEIDEYADPFFNYSNQYLGIDWMVRPRFELSLKISLGEDGKSYSQTHLWL